MSVETESYIDKPEFSVFMQRLADERAAFVNPSTTTRRAGEILVI